VAAEARIAAWTGGESFATEAAEETEMPLAEAAVETEMRLACRIPTAGGRS
jgi:hypothetical protein